MIRRIDVLAILLAILLVFVCFPQGQAATVNEIVAVVNGEAITRYEMQQEMRNSPSQSAMGEMKVQMEKDAERERKVLRSMINERLFVQEANRLGISVPDEVIRSRLERIRQENGLSREELEEYLQERGRALDQFKERIRRKIKVNRLLSSMVRQKVVLTEEEVRSYYKEHKDDFLPPSEVELSLILMRDRQELKALRAKIRQGEMAFSQAARRHSVGPNAGEGGNMGAVAFDDLNKQLRDIVRDLEPEQVSRVFPFRNAYALMRLETMQSSRGENAFSRVRDEVRQEAYSRKVRQRFEEYVDKLSSKAVIDIRL
ncbi:MAG: SurA N-terminal domain-containing protein [Desulfohalobiaceae bacterium]